MKSVFAPSMATLRHGFELLSIIILICYTYTVSSRGFHFASGPHLFSLVEEHSGNTEPESYKSHRTSMLETQFETSTLHDEQEPSMQEIDASNPDIEGTQSISYLSSIGDYFSNNMESIISFCIAVTALYVYMNILGLGKVASNAVNAAADSKKESMKIMMEYSQSVKNNIPVNIETPNDTSQTNQTSQPVTPENPRPKSFLARLMTGRF